MKYSRALCTAAISEYLLITIPMDFSAWFEAYLGGHWHTFDARDNRSRLARLLVGNGRAMRATFPSPRRLGNIFSHNSELLLQKLINYDHEDSI
jgi:hypothetical protein